MSASEFRKEARAKLQGKWGRAALIAFLYSLFTASINNIERIIPKNFQGLSSIAVVVISVPVTYGLAVQFWKLYHGNTEVFGFITYGFSNFGRAWKVALWKFVKMLIPIILIFVATVLIGVNIVWQATATFNSAAEKMFSLGDYSATSRNNIYDYVFNLQMGQSSILSIVSSVLFLVAIIWLIIKSYSYKLANLVAIDNPNMLAKDCVNKSAELMKGKKWKLFCLELSFIGWSILCVFTLGIGFYWLAPYIQMATIAFYKFVAGNTKVEEPLQQESVIQEQ